MTVVQLAYGAVYIAIYRRKGEIKLGTSSSDFSKRTEHNLAFTFVSLANPEEYTFAICLQDFIGTSLQVGYLAQSLVFGSCPPLFFPSFPK